MSEQRPYVYPTISLSNWWKLRDLLRKRVPNQINDTYISQVMNMKPTSARSNVLPALRTLRLIGENDEPTPLVTRWREDSDYPEVCREMLEATYPPELIDVFPGPEVDRDSLQAWFRKNAGANDATAVKMAITYTLLIEADPEKGTRTEKNTRALRNANQTKNSTGSSKSSPSATSPDSGTPASDDTAYQTKFTKELHQPTIHVDVQIHISPETTSEQIESIFVNMAKYFND